MLHFVTAYLKQNKSRKQTLESAQYGLEISSKAGVHVKAVLAWVNMAFLPISRSRFKQRYISMLIRLTKRLGGFV